MLVGWVAGWRGMRNAAWDFVADIFSKFAVVVAHKQIA